MAEFTIPTLDLGSGVAWNVFWRDFNTHYGSAMIDDQTTLHDVMNESSPPVRIVGQDYLLHSESASLIEEICNAMIAKIGSIEDARSEASSIF